MVYHYFFPKYIYFVVVVVKLLFLIFNYLLFICIWLSQQLVKKKLKTNESTRFRTRIASVASLNHTPRPRRTWWCTFNLFPKCICFVLLVVKLLFLFSIIYFSYAFDYHSILSNKSKELNQPYFKSARPAWQAWIIPLDHGGRDGLPWFFSQIHMFCTFSCKIIVFNLQLFDFHKHLIITTYCQKISKEMNRLGFEPVLPAWQAWIIPLDHGGLDGLPLICFPNTILL